MSGNMIEYEETGWESVILQRIFLECDTYWSKKHNVSTSTSSRMIPISAILEYVKDNLPNSRIDLLTELRKCLESVALDGLVNWEQFRESAQHWITKIEHLDWQDGNKNTYKESQRIIELRTRIRRYEEENDTLREEASRTVELLTVLRRQRDSFKRELDRYTEKCQQLEKENDERRDALNELIRKERSSATALKGSLKKCEMLQQKLETAEDEIRAMVTVKGDLEKITKENLEILKRMEEIQSDFEEKQQECEFLKTALEKLEETCGNRWQAQEQIIRDLREKNRQLMEENSELRSLSAVNTYSFEDKFFTSPHPNIRHCSIYDASTISDRGDFENSLFLELKASGFTTECGRNDSRNRELEEELNVYDEKISYILKQINSAIRTLAVVWKQNRNGDSSVQIPGEEIEWNGTRFQNFETLTRRVSFLLQMVSEATLRGDSKDSTTQTRLESTENAYLRDFNIMSFNDLLTVGNYGSRGTGTFVKPENNKLPFTYKPIEETFKNYTSDRIANKGMQKRHIKGVELFSSPVPLSNSTPLFTRTRISTKPDERESKKRRRRCLMVGESLPENRVNSLENFEGQEFRKRIYARTKREASPIISGLTTTRSTVHRVDEFNETDALTSEEAEIENELERKYTAFSIGLRADRTTLSRRLALSIRQRDLSEQNFAYEAQQLQQDIQEFSRCCTNRREEMVDSLERFQRRIETIVRCTTRIISIAETVGAVQQERRSLDALLLADNYSQVLKARYKRLEGQLVEAKRLLRNKRLSEKTIYGHPKEDSLGKTRRHIRLCKTEDTLRYNGYVHGGRTNHIRKQQSYEIQRRQDVMSTRTEQRSESDVSYTRERNNNERKNIWDKNLKKGVMFDEFDTVYHTANDAEIWLSANEGSTSGFYENIEKQAEKCIGSSVGRMNRAIKSLAACKPILCYLIIFFLGFYANHIIRIGNACGTSSLKWWSVEEILRPYFKVDKRLPPPI